MKKVMFVFVLLLAAASPCIAQQQSEPLESDPCRVWLTLSESDDSGAPLPAYCQIGDDIDPFGQVPIEIPVDADGEVNQSVSLAKTLHHWVNTFLTFISRGLTWN